MLRNPFIGNAPTKKIKSIKAHLISDKYKKNFNIDVSNYFSGLSHIDIYECQESGYRFYYPFNLSGDSSFYEHLQNFEWYYRPWKWEHQVCEKHINSDTKKVLEVGSGTGSFLKEISSRHTFSDCIGLELNKESACEKENFRILNTTIQEFSIHNENQFDLVCSFQVLEHISDVYSFLEAKIRCTKENGTIVVSVPNNDSFLKYEDDVLNMPPHHMGLWHKGSLSKIAELFNLKVEKVYYEPLRPNHYSYYLNAMMKKHFGSFIGKKVAGASRILGLYPLLQKTFLRNPSGKKGHSIVVVFKKT